MRNYVGIDLGTTNSAICSYDGKTVRIWKSPEQNDVTPSAIFVDRRGNRHYGMKAYNQAPYNPNNSATLFKRFMGTNTKITLESVNLTLTPEECSAEILKVLYGYLPEEIRNDPETGTVITVPAAFNQMKKDATMEAARKAGIPNVELMQEPVAAIMSVMRSTEIQGIFLIYDLGGGTFDVSVAENIGGKVHLLAHGGIEMCGGRDIDRKVFQNIVVPWLRSQFSLPDDFLSDVKYKTFCRVAQWATERAKIELSSSPVATIALSEQEARCTDEMDEEMYLDIDLDRNDVDQIIGPLIEETIDATREILAKAHLDANDIGKIVFIGGPTNYKPLRDRVASELALPADINVNPMTAVAEGASIYAESVDWFSKDHTRKTSNSVVRTDIGLSLKYTARTSGSTAKIMCLVEGPIDGYTISFTSVDTGWSSGTMNLQDKVVMTVPLSKNGDNRFKVVVQDNYGRSVPQASQDIVITRTLATISSIPASHAIAIEVLNKIGGTSELDFLVREGDSLPSKGTKVFKAAESLRAGSRNIIAIKLWEGSIPYPITDNRFIGNLKISGTDFENGEIKVGDEIICDYEISDSGAIRMDISVPRIQASFSQHNYYSRQEGQMDLNDEDVLDQISDEGRDVLSRIEELEEKVNSPKLEQAKAKAEGAASLEYLTDIDAEEVQKANNDLLDAKKLLSEVRQSNLQTIRQMELDSEVDMFNKTLRQHATSEENRSFDQLVHLAQQSIERNDNDYDSIYPNIRSIVTGILLRQDWFIIELYHSLGTNPADFLDTSRFRDLKRIGDTALAKGDIAQLRQVISELISIMKRQANLDEMFDQANIIRG